MFTCSKIYLFKVNSRVTRTIWEIWSKLTVKIPERCQWHFFVSIVKFEQIYFFGGVCWLGSYQKDFSWCPPGVLIALACNTKDFVIAFVVVVVVAVVVFLLLRFLLVTVSRRTQKSFFCNFCQLLLSGDNTGCF